MQVVLIKRFLPTVFFLVLSLAANTTQAGNNQEVAGTIRFFKTTLVGSELTLIINHAPLSKVLDVIAAKSKVSVHYSLLPTELISTRCVASHLKALLSCLLGEKAGFVVSYQLDFLKENQEQKPSEVWLLQLPQSLSHSMPAIVNDASVENEQEATVVTDATEKLLEQALLPARRVQAISMLAHADRKDDVRVRQALKAAMSDEKPEVRAQAIFALAKRDGDAAQADLKLALQDKNSEVRMMVVGSINNDRSLLQQAMQDPDANVRQLASLKLQSLAGTNAN
jgi:hypothetical protein